MHTIHELPSICSCSTSNCALQSALCMGLSCAGRERYSESCKKMRIFGLLRTQLCTLSYHDNLMYAYTYFTVCATRKNGSIFDCMSLCGVKRFANCFCMCATHCTATHLQQPLICRHVFCTYKHMHYKKKWFKSAQSTLYGPR